MNTVTGPYSSNLSQTVSICKITECMNNVMYKLCEQWTWKCTQVNYKQFVAYKEIIT